MKLIVSTSSTPLTLMAPPDDQLIKAAAARVDSMFMDVRGVEKRLLYMKSRTLYTGTMVNNPCTFVREAFSSVVSQHLASETIPSVKPDVQLLMPGTDLDVEESHYMISDKSHNVLVSVQALHFGRSHFWSFIATVLNFTN